MVVMLLAAGAASAAGIAAGTSSGNRKAADARHQRDTAVAAADQSLLSGVAAAQKQRDEANQRAQQALAGEQPAKDAATKAKNDYIQKLNSLNNLAAQLKQRETAVSGRENAVQQRENAVAVAERGLQATAFSGDGVFIVGRDIQPGTYQSPGVADGAGECYYARLASTNSTDIIDNNGTTGPNVVTVSPGDVALEVSGCQDFKKIG
jgi:hypothetical protein